MKFGLFYLPTYLPAIRDVQAHYRGIIEQVEFAERIGIDYVWLVEHHFVRHGGLFPANYAFLSYLAGSPPWREMFDWRVLSRSEW